MSYPLWTDVCTDGRNDPIIERQYFLLVLTKSNSELTN